MLLCRWFVLLLLPLSCALSPPGMASVVGAKLSKIVAANQLQAFYPPDKLAGVTARITQRVDFHALAARWAAARLAAQRHTWSKVLPASQVLAACCAVSIHMLAVAHSLALRQGAFVVSCAWVS